jgi:iron complex transport system ATP-binding protein
MILRGRSSSWDPELIDLRGTLVARSVKGQDPAMTGLVARGVTVDYPDRGRVLEGVDLEVRPGELVAVLGPNGAGKSTLLRALAGTAVLAAGEVLLEGRALRSLARADIARDVAVVPQLVDVALGFRVDEVVAMGRAPHQGSLLVPSSDDRRRVTEALARCDLEGLAHRPVDRLSGGEQRRVAIARALCQGGRVLLLDEPTAYLDIRHARDLYELLRREVDERGLACLTILHDLNAAAQYADRVVLLADGRVVASGPVEEVMTYVRLKEVFDAELYVGVNEVEGTRYFVPMRAPRG